MELLSLVGAHSGHSYFSGFVPVVAFNALFSGGQRASFRRLYTPQRIWSYFPGIRTVSRRGAPSPFLVLPAISERNYSVGDCASRGWSLALAQMLAFGMEWSGVIFPCFNISNWRYSSKSSSNQAHALPFAALCPAWRRYRRVGCGNREKGILAKN